MYQVLPTEHLKDKLMGIPEFWLNGEVDPADDLGRPLQNIEVVWD